MVVRGETDGNGEAEVLGYTDYYSGATGGIPGRREQEMPGRQNTAWHRYAYQGIEKDPETGWSAFTLRMGACPELGEGTAASPAGPPPTPWGSFTRLTWRWGMIRWGWWIRVGDSL